MPKRCLALCLTVFVFFIGIAANAQEKSLKRTITERFLGSIDFSILIRDTFKVSPDGRRVAYAARLGDKWLVVVDDVEEKKHDHIVGNITFDSPTTLHYLTLKGISLYLVEEKIE